MKRYVSSKEMQELDRLTIEYFRMPQLVLMERAALSVKDAIWNIKETEGKHITECLVVCGSGNNGADGVALARLLNQAGLKTSIYLVNDHISSYSEALKIQLQIYRNYAYSELEALDKMDGYDLLVDAIFGVGLSRDIEGKFYDIIQKFNSAEAYKIAIDLPSGVNADDGTIFKIAAKVNKTITFAFDKIGLHMWPGFEYAGSVCLYDIGITDVEKECDQKDLFPKVFSLQVEDLKSLPKRVQHSNKGTYGKVLVIAGSEGMAGAAYLCAKAAYRSGAGLVYIFTQESNRTILQQMLPEAVIYTYSSNQDMHLLDTLVDKMDAVVIGPGLALGDMSKEILVNTLTKFKGKPIVVDADAISLLARMNEDDLQDLYSEKVVITPHLAEASRLLHKSVTEIQSNLIANARDYSLKYGIQAVFKDCKTIIALPDKTVFMNESGNNGMATGGSGDVLAGLTAGLLAQGLDWSMAGAISAFIHGMAGDLAAERKGQHGMIAEDIIDAISDVLKCVES